MTDKSPEVVEEIFLTFKEAGTPVAIMYANGYKEFYKLKKMTREEIYHLLQKQS